MTSKAVRGRLVTRSGVVEDGFVLVEDGRLTTVAPVAEHAHPQQLPERAGTVLPGLVDMHLHGGGGASVTSGDPAETVAVAAHHRSAGTTSLLLSTVTDSADRMLDMVASAAACVEAGEATGVHLEGPFLAATRCGAQDPRHLRLPDPSLARELLDAGRGAVRTMTIAPELPGSDRLMDLLQERHVLTAVGHTDGEAATIAQALARPGVDLVTHLFNGMPPMHHRSPGPVAVALSAAARGQVRVELVADGVHLADETVRMVFDLLGPDRVVLVTDAMAAAGMPDGDYVLGPQRVQVTGGVARLRDAATDSIAGGTATLLDVVRRCVQRAGVDLHAAVMAASASPAFALGLAGTVGELAPGRRADLLVVDDDNLTLRRVMRGGRWCS